MSVYTKEVIRIGTRSKGKNTWTIITTKDDKGKERDENIIVDGNREAQEALSAKFTTPGKYKLEYQKINDYWSLVGAELLSANGGAVASTSSGAAKSSTPPASAPATAVGSVANARIEVAKMAVEGAVTLTAAMVHGGLFESSKPSDVENSLLLMIRSISNEAANFITRSAKAPNTPPADAQEGA